MNEQVKILFVDDDEDELVILQGLLKEQTQQEYIITWVSTFELAINKVTSTEEEFDICIIDYRLGRYNGIELLKKIRGINAKIPVILFTGQGDSRVDIEAMRAGASDYLVKGKIDVNILERSIRYSVNEARVQQRLIEQEKNLRESEKFAITGRIALVIAHEIRNPLTNVKLALHQLRDEVPFNETALQLFSIAERNSTRINELITHLLESTKFSTLKTEDISVNALIDEVLETASDRIKLSNIKVIKKYSYDVCDIHADREKIKIALLNIIINAVEAMEKDRGVLIVSTEGKNGKCVIKISDNGAGISEENMNSIFEPYFSKKENGIGLGLTSTQTIIYNHKGTINVESSVSKGTTFTIAFDFSPSAKPIKN